jgi:hypothetical protein
MNMTIEELHHSEDWLRPRRATTMAMATTFDIPVIGSMASGFAIGFMKGNDN